MSVEDRAVRLRRGLEVVIEQAARADDGLARRGDVWAVVERECPLTGDDAVLNRTGRRAGETAWLFSTSDLVGAGWLHKDGNGGWQPTAVSRDALEEYVDPQAFAKAAHDGYLRGRAEQQERRTALLMSGIVPIDDGEENVRRATKLFAERGLWEGMSVFAPERRAWTIENAETLVGAFADVPDVAGRTFVDKLAVQLADVSDDAKLLMAELVTWQLLPMDRSAIGEIAKRERVQAILALMDHPVRIPDAIDSAFARGSFHPGVRMASNLHGALSIIVRLVRTWLDLAEERREELLGSPWAWRDFVRDIPGERFPSQRMALDYLVHPSFFGPIVSEPDRRRIVEHYIGEITAPAGDVDRDLFAIATALQVKADGPVDFYSPPYVSEWREELVGPEGEPRGGGGGFTPFPPATDELSHATHIDRAWLQRTIDLIARRRQVIFYGPPGTGKTYLARRLAEHIGGRTGVRLVQFHPSYSYEDFFEGYRPVLVDGQLGYELRPGPLRRLASEAARNPELTYVLVIDEINRGNLSKVFGELYFLLEYRDASVRLLYSSDEEFSLPSNVVIIGTMNSADRSIALMDSAMRRRFAFIELHPAEPPTRGILPAWLSERGLEDEPARLLDQLNRLIPDRDNQIGPSYLMPEDGDLGESRLAEIWRHEILPLLSELHFGDGIDIERCYGLAALRRAPVDGEPMIGVDERA